MTKRSLENRLERAGIQPERVQLLNDAPVQSRGFVLYWMQAAQRASGNHALEAAILHANELGQPVVALFALTDAYPGANLRHYAFLLEGLAETAGALAKRGIPLVVDCGDPPDVVERWAADASLVVSDRGYTRVQRSWRETLAGAVDARLLQVESDVVVPAEWASTKEEYAARTLRPRIHKQLDRYLVPLRKQKAKQDGLGLQLASALADGPEALLAKLDIDRTVAPAPGIRGGYAQGKKRLQRFVRTKLGDYEEQSNDPTVDGTSDLSPYLHFGQIGPLEVALAVQRKGGKGTDAFLEQLIVRRELAVNFVLFNPDYDTYTSVPEWARATLRKHARDRRPYRYTRQQLEEARTEDPYWNAAQQELVHLGRIHNYMRMYWGKKVLEWTGKPETAFRWLVDVNDRYELDGRDPNGYAGVAWCFGKHDRPWPERDVFGTVRSMNAKGLARKFDRDAYVRQVTERLAAAG